jgi:hypothetical protein
VAAEKNGLVLTGFRGLRELVDHLLGR